jgi:hypothetical protein
MCEPITIGLMAAGSLLDATGQIRAGNERKKIADRNAELADFAAVDAEKRGATEAGLARMKTSKVVGQQAAAIGSSGVDIASGTPQAVMDETRAIGELDAQTVRNNAAREAWGYRSQGQDFRDQGKLDQQTSTFGAASTLLGGAAHIGPRAWKLVK